MIEVIITILGVCAAIFAICFTALFIAGTVEAIEHTKTKKKGKK